MLEAGNASPDLEGELDADFTQLSSEFFSLDAYDKELDLFCSLTELEPDRGWLSRKRDGFYWKLYSVMRVQAGRNRRSLEDIETWSKRLKKWRCHIDTFLWIKEGKDRSPDLLPRFDATINGCKRLDLLFDHLKIMDGKFSMLLTVNSVLVALVALSLKELTDLFKEIGVRDPFHFWLKWASFLILAGLLVWIIFHCFFNLWYGIRGFRRVVWGELDSRKGWKKSEDDYSRFLIYSLARRTCLFRIVSESTRRGYRLFFWFAFFAGFVLTVKTVESVYGDWGLSHPAKETVTAAPAAQASPMSREVPPSVPKVPQKPPTEKISSQNRKPMT